MKRVATAFLIHEGDVLLLRRGAGAPSYPLLWSAVSGGIEEGETPVDAAVREVAEETGLSVDPRGMIGMGMPFTVDGFLVNPVAFLAGSRDVTLCAENVDFRWVRPAEISTFPTVPLLEAAFTDTCSHFL